MSLFDDLLTKVQSPSSAVSNSTGWSGQQDPVVKINGPITISESTPIVTNQEIRTAPVEPPVIIAAPVEPPVITITEAPMIGMTPIQEESEVVNITPIQEESSVQDSFPLFDMTVPLMDNVEDENPNNFMITREDTSPFMEEWFAKNETPEIILGDDTMSSSPLFDISSDSISPSTVLSEWDSLVEDKKVEDTSYKTTSSETTYRNTKEYLKHAFEEVEVLIATIDRENDNKIKEREGYKQQKEHFAKLELQADWEHQKMLEERAHAKRMKTYLEHEQAKSELPVVNSKKITAAKTVVKKITHVVHAKNKATKPRAHTTTNHTNFAQVA